MFEDLPIVRPRVSLDMPTQESLRAEAAALGDSFPEVTAHPADLIADADEMLTASEDLADLQSRGYVVSSGLLHRIKLLKDELVPMLAEEDQAVLLSKAQTAQGEEARSKLLKVRRDLARIGKAAGLPASLFSLETKKTTRLNVVLMKMGEVLSNVRAVYDRLPDKQRVDRLVTEARASIDAQLETRAASKLFRIDRTRATRLRNRVMRLLYDAMLHVSDQGLAAYPDDPVKEPRYRLDHIYGRSPSAVQDPGAGGGEGFADAAGPQGDDD